MSGSSFFAWLTTSQGKNFVRGTATAVCFGSGCLVFLPHWLGLKKYQEIKQLYKYGEPVPVDERVNKIAEEELQKCTFMEDEQKLFIRFFTVHGFDVFNAGSVHVQAGSIIGIPINFKYLGPSDIDYETIQVGGKSINWSSRYGKRLEKSLLLSDKALRFVINRELYNVTCQRHFDLLFTSTLLASTYYSGAMMNDKLNLLSRPRSVRLTLYGILSLICATTWFGVKDLRQVTLDRWADDAVAKLGSDYVEGGIEFYSKMMKKNSALHFLLGSNGGDWYTPKGNYNTWIRAYHLPLQQRLDTMKERLKDLTSDDSKESETAKK